MPTKVSHLVYSFGMGGLERVIVNLANHTQDTDIEHSIITLVDDHSFATLLRPGIKLYCLNKKEGKDFSCHGRLYKLLKSIKPDVLHTYNFGCLEYQITAFFSGVKKRIHAEHGKETSYKASDRSRKNELFRRIVSPFLNYFVVVSKDLQQWARDDLNLGEKKLKLIFNGISLSEFDKTVDDDKCWQFATVGRLVDVKNHSLLVDAFARACEIEPDLKNERLAIVGDGPNYDALKKQISKLELDDQITLTGYCQDIPSVLRQTKVFVLSSRYEAQPMTALEAMSCRLPVIAPKVGGVEYILENDRNGILVSPDDAEAMAKALVRAYRDPKHLNDMGDRGREIVEANYSVSCMSESYTQLYLS